MLGDTDGREQYADGVFSAAPIFNYNNDNVKFNTNFINNTNDKYGSASAFLPKYLQNRFGIRKTGAFSLIHFSLI